MSDVKSIFIDMGLGIDLALTDAGLLEDVGLETAVIISLFTDSRAIADEVASGDDPRGVWTDSLFNTTLGSKRWLLSRSKQNNETLLQLIDYDRRALKWLVDQNLAETIDIDAHWLVRGTVSEKIDIHLTNNTLLAFTIDSQIEHWAEVIR